MATIILTGGGSAGHCTPHLAVLPYLKDKFDKIYYIGSENGIEKSIVSKAKIPYFSIPCVKLKREFTLSNLKIPFTLHKGIKSAEKLIKRLKPDVIFSKGGYVSLPVVLAAKKRKIPVIAHESDYTVGLANKISSRYCKKVLTSFPETAKNLKNGIYVGSPIRKKEDTLSKEKLYEYFGFKKIKPIILVTGGSLGAKKINEVLRNSLKELLKDYNILHICGKNNKVKNIYGEGYSQFEFVDKMDYAFSISDACISRAGSNAVFELLSEKIPTLLIPLPKAASRGDQILNAKYFTAKGLTSMIYQEDLTPESLIYNVNLLIKAKDVVKSRISAAKIEDKSKVIAQFLLNECKR